uniref:Reverse transcriptase domain-containing protein n=1 Tax=Tanacetum cinerariifolium TaxID=118510 RepID=A0A6L2LYE8_TANCI|nr:reverse transcriptase domain-containing protein [Tanacetum cinerariifolium]
MRTHSSSNLVGESSSNRTTSNPKHRNHRRSKQPFSLKESPLDTMADQRTMAKLLRAPTEGYAETIDFPPILAEHFELKHSLINMMTSDKFFRLEKDNPHDHIPDQDCLNSTASGNLLERRTQDVLTIIENKSKVHNSRNNLIVSQVKSSDVNSSSSSEIAKLTHAVNQQTSAVIYSCSKSTPPLTFVKAIEEICFTCGAAVNYNQGNPGYHPLRPLPSNTIANPRGKLKAITTRSGLALDKPSIHIPPPFINLEEDEHAEETFKNP